MKAHYHLLLAGALLGAAAAACDPKTIGDESAGNLVCEDGEKKEAGDGCNTCTCVNGDWACTEIACGECVDGETMPAADGCNTCSCENGMWACTLIGCPATEGGDGVCGDGIVQAGEECDDGNGASGDGCTPACTLEGGDMTTGGDTTTGGETATDGDTDANSETATDGGTAVCGNGVVEVGEQCDDGNAVDGDGCSTSCKLEGGGGPLSCVEPVKIDMFVLTSAAIVGDTLQVDVEYGGGCETHDFSYCWDGIFLESFPVQVHTKIGHDAHNDACEAWLMDTLEFDLSDLKQAYQDGYQTQSGEIAISLENWGEPLLYSF